MLSVTTTATSVVWRPSQVLPSRSGHRFRAAPEQLFSADGFHPSADGYRVWAHALYPAVLDAAQAAGRRSTQE